MRIIIVFIASLGLAGCASTSLDMFKSTPPTATLQLESQPAGAEARVPSGQACKTPCSLSVPASENFSVTFNLPKYQPETIDVQVKRDQTDSSGGVLVDPNPVYAELKPGGPPKKKSGKAAPKAKRPKTTAAPAPAADDSSLFPPPPSR
jgi:hypothetical protein